MKKYLPIILLVLVFSSTLVQQIMWNALLSDDLETTNSHLGNGEYEHLFMNGSYTDVRGEKIVMSQLSAPLVIYNFWASWCGPCLAEMPSMLLLKKKFSPGEVEIVAINTDEENQLSNLKRVASEMKIENEFILIPDKASKIVTDFGVSAIPMTVVFHRGKVVHVSKGPMDFSSEEFVEKVKNWIHI